jgi:hypothetical protein
VQIETTDRIEMDASIERSKSGSNANQAFRFRSSDEA